MPSLVRSVAVLIPYQLRKERKIGGNGQNHVVRFPGLRAQSSSYKRMKRLRSLEWLAISYKGARICFPSQKCCRHLSPMSYGCQIWQNPSRIRSCLPMRQTDERQIIGLMSGTPDGSHRVCWNRDITPLLNMMNHGIVDRTAPLYQ